MRRKFSSADFQHANMILAMLIVILILAPLLLLFLSLLSNHQLPPGPNTLQFLPTLSRFRNKPHIAFKNLAQVYGPLISIRFGFRVVIVASSPSIAREILKTNDRVLSGRFVPSLYYDVPGTESSVALSRDCSGTWKSLREIFHKFLLSSRAVDLKVEIRKQKVMEMMDYLQGKKGETVKLDDIVSATIGNILTGVLASRNMFDVRGGDQREQKVTSLVNEILEMASAPGLADLFPVFTRVDFWSKRCALDMHAKITALFGDIIKERRSRRGTSEDVITNQDFLHVLVGINELSDDQISIILMEIMLAGQDTTVITAIWLMVELLRNQDILHKVRKEIAETVIKEDGTINESNLSTCKYFQACIKETLRLHIPGPFLLPHRALEKCEVNDYVIPKDSIVIVNAWAVHMDDDYWNEAATFKPDRFLDSKVDFVGNCFEFFPFSLGRRKCPGMHMAFANIELVVASLMHYFDWSLPDGVHPRNLDMDETFVTTLKREKPLCLIPRLREQYVV